MPVTRKHDHETNELSRDQRRELLHGSCFFDGFSSLAEMRPAWKKHRATLREEWAATNPPGTRCFGEWLFELVPKFGERRLTDFGRRTIIDRSQFERHGIVHTHTVPEMQEPEHEFLFRHGIIGETEYRAAVAYESR